MTRHVPADVEHGLGGLGKAKVWKETGDGLETVQRHASFLRVFLESFPVEITMALLNPDQGRDERYIMVDGAGRRHAPGCEKIGLLVPMGLRNKKAAQWWHGGAAGQRREAEGCLYGFDGILRGMKGVAGKAIGWGGALRMMAGDAA